jgi:hypothetical protein
MMQPMENATPEGDNQAKPWPLNGEPRYIALDEDKCSAVFIDRPATMALAAKKVTEQEFVSLLTKALGEIGLPLPPSGAAVVKVVAGVSLKIDVTPGGLIVSRLAL